jgi:ABC-2 type transport system permease protein
MSEMCPRGGVWGGRPPGLALPGPGSVLGSQIRYQLTLIIRNPRAISAGLILPGALLALEAGKAQHVTMAQAAPRIAGLIALSAAAIALFTHALGLVTAREEGVLRRWHASPLPTWACFAGRIVATMLVTAAAGLILVLVAVAMTGVHLTAHAVLGLLVVDALGALALAAAGTAITAIIPSIQSAQPVLMLAYVPLIVLSGGFGALQSLPHWLNTAVTYLPAQPVIDAASRSLAHGSGAIMSVHDLAVLAGWVAGGLLVSFWFFQWDPHRPAHARRAEARTTARSE